MDGGVTQKVRNLGEIHLVFPYELFGVFDFHFGKKFNHASLLIFPEQFLELGTPDQIIVTDILNGNVFPDMIFQITNNFVVEIGMALGTAKAVCGGSKLRNSKSADHADQELFQISHYQLLRSEETVGTLLHFCEIGIIERGGNTAPGLGDEHSHQSPLRIRKRQNPVFKEIHGR